MKTEHLLIVCGILCVLFCCGGFLIGYNAGKPDSTRDLVKAEEQLTYDLQNVRKLEEFYHEKLKNLPECKYDPSVYNSLFNSNR